MGISIKTASLKLIQLQGIGKNSITINQWKISIYNKVNEADSF